MISFGSRNTQNTHRLMLSVRRYIFASQHHSKELHWHCWNSSQPAYRLRSCLWLSFWSGFCHIISGINYQLLYDFRDTINRSQPMKTPIIRRCLSGLYGRVNWYVLFSNASDVIGNNYFWKHRQNSNYGSHKPTQNNNWVLSKQMAAYDSADKTRFDCIGCENDWVLLLRQKLMISYFSDCSLFRLFTLQT